MQAATDLHCLPAVERNCRTVAGKYVQERNLAARHDLASDRAEQGLRVTTAGGEWMDAGGRHVVIIAGLHPLARHRDKLAVDLDAKERSQFMRPRAEGARF